MINLAGCNVFAFHFLDTKSNKLVFKVAGRHLLAVKFVQTEASVEHGGILEFGKYST